VGTAILVGSDARTGGAQTPPSEAVPVPGFAILPAPGGVAEEDLAAVFERYVDAYRDPREVEGWRGSNCGSYASVPCAPVLYRCVRDLKWGCPDDAFFSRFLPPFRALLLRLPGDRFATGQGVYAYLGLGRSGEADSIAEACTHSDSWCAMLRAVVAYDQARFEDANGEFEKSFAGMSGRDRCAFTDLRWLFERSADYRRLECEERRATNEVVWWLSDPFWSVPGNARKLEHWNRTALNILHDDFLELESRPGAVVDDEGHPLSHHASSTRFGLDGPDGRAADPARGARWVPSLATQFHFVPGYDAVRDPLDTDADDWALAPDRPWEFFRHPEWRKVVEIPSQIATFWRPEGMVVVASTDLALHAISDGAARSRGALVLSSGPGDFVTHSDTVSRSRYAFRDTVVEGTYLAGVEVLAEGDQIAGRTRYAIGLPEGPEQPLRISDLLLYEATSDTAGASDLEEASRVMLGREWVTPDTRLGVYWEVYGALENETVEIELTASPIRGFFGRLGAIFGGGTGALVVGWREGAILSSQGEMARSVHLDLSRLEPGRYRVQLRVTVPGQLPVVSQRELEIR